MNYLTKRLKIGIAALFAFALAIGTLTADEPSAPRLFNAFTNFDDDGIFYNWEMPNQNDDIDGFRFYIASDVTDDYRDFEMFSNVSYEDVIFDGVFFYNDPVTLDEGIYTLYMTAYNQDGESEPSNFWNLRNNDPWPEEMIYFEEYPEMLTAPLDEEFEYRVEATCEDEDRIEDIRYQILDGPDGLEIDEESGLVTWTPEETGLVHALIRAYFVDEQGLFADLYLTIYTPECDEPGVINVSLVDEEGNPIESANVYLISYNNNYQEGLNYFGEIEDGTASVEVDAGTYYLAVDGEKVPPTLFPGVRDMDRAETVSVDCGEAVTVEMTVETILGPPEEEYTVSGYVFNAETDEPISDALVEFRSSNDGRYGTWFGGEAFTDENGYYELVLPGPAEYMAMCFMAFDPETGTDFMPQFYDRKENPDDADLIELDEDVENINFYLEPFEVPEVGSISGRVETENGDPVVESFVIAFLVDADDYYSDYIFQGHFAMSNEIGEYVLENLYPGEYVVLTIPFSSDYAPGFYVANDFVTMSWEDATRIDVDGERVEDINLVLPAIDAIPGVCQLSGIVTAATGEVKSGDEAPLNSEVLSGANVYLANVQTGDVHKFAKSGENGAYSLRNIKEGVYNLVIDKVGFAKYSTIVELDDSRPIKQIDAVLQKGAVAGIDEENPFEVNVYPNPASSVVKIDFEGKAGISDILIMSIDGKVLLEKSIVSVDGTNTLELDVENLGIGMHPVRITSGGETSTYPIIIAR